MSKHFKRSLPPVLISLLRSSTFLLICILLFALLPRFYKWGYYPLGFDQVQILTNAQDITQGNITLIGPRTGPAQMFTGPLIYYLTAGLLFAIPSPYTLIATSLVLTLATGIGLWLVTRRALNSTSALLVMVVWAASPFLIAMDRITWNPSLTLLASSLVFFPIYRLLRLKDLRFKETWFDYLLIAVGAFLGYQAHFSGLLLPGLAFFSLLFLRPKLAVLAGVAAGLGLAASLVPTLIFDIRYNWLNLNGLLQLGQDNSDSLLIDRIKAIIASFASVIRNSGWVVFWDSNAALPFVAGLGLVILQVHNFSKAKNKTEKYPWLFPLLWLAFITVCFSFYQKPKPEYYFLIQIPAVLLMLEQSVLSKFQSLNAKLLFVVLMMIYALTFAVTKFQVGNGTNLLNQLEVMRTLQRQAVNNPIKSFSFDMKEVDSEGLRYLLRDWQFDPNGDEIHLVYPTLRNTLSSYSSNDMGYWTDSRTKPGYHYVTQPRYIIGTDESLSVLPQSYPSDLSFDADQYQILLNGNTVTDLYVVENSRHERDFYHFVNNVFPKTDIIRVWKYFETDEFTGWMYQGTTHLFLIPTTAAQKAILDPLVTQIEIVD